MVGLPRVSGDRPYCGSLDAAIRAAPPRERGSTPDTPFCPGRYRGSPA